MENERNTEYTERAENEAPPSQVVELGEYHDVAPTGAAMITKEPIQSVFRGFNATHFDLNGALNREYPLATVNWALTDTAGTKLQSFQFPQVLFNIPFIAEKIEDFRYFVGGVRVTMRMTTNKFLYGKVIASYIPFASEIPAFVSDCNAGVLTRISGYPHILISAASGDAVTIDIPFVNWNRVLDLRNYIADEIGRVTINVFNPLYSMTDPSGATPSSAEIFVTAQFVDACVMMPHVTVQSNSTSDFGVTLQSNRKSHYQPHTNYHPKMSHDTKPPDMEAIEKSKGVLSQAWETTKALPGKIITGIANAAYNHSIDAAGAMVAGAVLGLNKPMTENQTAVMTINPAMDFPYGRGIDTSTKLAMDPENRISTVPNMTGIAEDEMMLNYIIGTPTLVNQVVFVQGSTPIELTTTQLTYNTPSYLKFVANWFEYSSGSLKVKLYITASLFHSARFVIWLDDNNTPTADNWQDCYHKVIDVQGDTEIDFMVPYTSPAVADATGGPTNPFKLYVAELSWSTPDPNLSSPITFNVYLAGNSDFRFGVQREMRVVLQSNPRSDFCADFDFMHEDMQTYLQQNLLYGEEYTTLREIVHRYNFGKVVECNVQHEVWEGLTSTNSTKLGVEAWSVLFAFWRGSLNLRFYDREWMRSNANGSGYKMAYLVSDLTGTEFNLPGMVESTSTNPTIPVNVPFYTNRLFLSTDEASDMRYLVTGPTYGDPPANPSVYEAISAGDDFSFHFLVPPPALDLQAVPTTTTNVGLSGFRRYLNFEI